MIISNDIQKITKEEYQLLEQEKLQQSCEDERITVKIGGKKSDLKSQVTFTQKQNFHIPLEVVKMIQNTLDCFDEKTMFWMFRLKLGKQIYQLYENGNVNLKLKQILAEKSKQLGGTCRSLQKYYYIYAKLKEKNLIQNFNSLLNLYDKKFKEEKEVLMRMNRGIKWKYSRQFKKKVLLEIEEQLKMKKKSLLKIISQKSKQKKLCYNTVKEWCKQFEIKAYQYNQKKISLSQDYPEVENKLLDLLVFLKANQIELDMWQLQQMGKNILRLFDQQAFFDFNLSWFYHFNKRLKVRGITLQAMELEKILTSSRNKMYLNYKALINKKVQEIHQKCTKENVSLEFCIRKIAIQFDVHPKTVIGWCQELIKNNSYYYSKSDLSFSKIYLQFYQQEKTMQPEIWNTYFQRKFISLNIWYYELFQKMMNCKQQADSEIKIENGKICLDPSVKLEQVNDL